MKKLFKRLPKKLVLAVAVLAVLAGAGAIANATFGPDRETRTWTNQENGFQHVTFDSYTGVPNGIGDERDFFRGVQVGRDTTWTDPVANVGQGQEVEAHVYIHNDADPLLNNDGTGIAKNVTVRVQLPTGSKQSQQATAFISSANATPTQIFDTLDLTGANSGFFELAYVPGSAKLIDQGKTTALTAAQEQAMIGATGVNIGDQKACFEFVREITFRVKVNMPGYGVQKQVRLDGTGPGNWKDTVAAKPGDTVEWNIHFTNEGKTQLNNVEVIDNVPANTTAVAKTVTLWNANHPTGLVYEDTAIQGNGKQVHVTMGDYAPNGAGDVSFKTKIASIDQLPCGTTTITNDAFVRPEGYGAIDDTATVTVKGKDCVTPTAPVCNALTLDRSDRTVKATVTYSPNGHTFKNVTVDFGDKTDPALSNQATNNTVVISHTYGASVTTATVKATVNFSDVNQPVSSEACTKTVDFSTTPTELVKTGPSDMLGIFLGTSAIGAVVYSLVARRRALSR